MMVAIVRCMVVGGLVSAIVLGAVGCGGGAAAKPRGAQARLLEEENYRLGEQVKGLEKQIETLKAEVAANLKEKDDKSESSAGAMKFLMDQITEKDTQIQKLQDKVAELEKK
jgi:hypothetical protein